MTPGTAIAFLPFAGAIALLVAWSDMSAMKIRNTACIAMFMVWVIIGPFAVMLTDLPLQDWLWGFALAGMTLVAGFIANAVRLVGGGDSKYAAAIAPFFIGADPRWVVTLFAACLLGAFVTHRVFKLIPILRGWSPDWESWRRKDFPMGLALSGTLVFHLLFTIWRSI